MRKIEEKIIDRIKYSGATYADKSISIRDRVKLEGINQFSVYLWNNLIFCKSAKNGKYFFSFAGYNTNTTKCRINAFLSSFVACSPRIYQKNYELFFTSGRFSAKEKYTKKINSLAWYELNFDTVKNYYTIKEIKSIYDYL